MCNLLKLTLILIFICLGGCLRTELSAPPGQEVRILSRDEPVNFRTEYKNWYLLYGMIPIWTTQPEEIIKEQKLVEVRAQTKDTVADAIITVISSFLPILIFTQHVIVEGNRESDVPVQSLPVNNDISLENPVPGNQSIH